jgi:hypothetical protein
MEIEAVGEDSSTTVGGVWALAAFTLEEWNVVGKDLGTFMPVPARNSPTAGCMQNRFSALSVEGETGWGDGRWRLIERLADRE